MSRVERARRLLAEGAEGIDRVLGQLAEGSPGLKEVGRMVWEPYLKVELATTLIKLEAGVETPGTFTEPPKEDGLEALLVRAGDGVREASNLLGEGRLEEALSTIREARDALKAVLSKARG
jgi:hypothetical protein